MLEKVHSDTHTDGGSEAEGQRRQSDRFTCAFSNLLLRVRVLASLRCVLRCARIALRNLNLFMRILINIIIKWQLSISK